MRIRKVSIDRFRGIKHLDWTLDSRFVCLIGPGDSTKTTILDAIELALSSRWSIPFADVDFYMADYSEPLEIRVTVAEPPADLLADDRFGLSLRGWDVKRGIVDDPDDGCEPVLTVRLRVDSSLDPVWTVIKYDADEGKRISAKDRERLGVYRLGVDVDRHLSWGKGSALSRLTESLPSAQSYLADAARQLRDGLQKQSLPQLAEAAEQGRRAAVELGLGNAQKFAPGLDTRQVSLGMAALTLHEGTVPVSCRGTGGRRLAALGLQKSGVPEGAILLIDEIEHGLEPFRIRRLLQAMKNSGNTTPSGQVLTTTHSTIVVVELDASALHIVRSASGQTKVNAITPIEDALQALVRSASEALFARRVIVCEGKTELGVCRALSRYWAKLHDGEPLSYRGVVCAVGGEGGGTEAPSNAMRLRSLGYEVAYFGDSDRPLSPGEQKLTEVGIRVILWEGAVSIEERIACDLPLPQLQSLVDLAAQHFGEQSVTDKIASHLQGSQFTSAVIQDWLQHYTEDQIRAAIGRAAKSASANSKAWFKRIDIGEELGEIVVSALSEIRERDLGKKIADLEGWAYDE